jgi:hypothetical protein
MSHVQKGLGTKRANKKHPSSYFAGALGNMIAPKMILEKFSDACKVLGHVLVMALQCSTTDFDELGVAPQALNLL